jgi:hypothetical protein
MVISFCVFSELRREVIVRFVDIGETGELMEKIKNTKLPA